MAKKEKLKLDDFSFDDDLDIPSFDFGGSDVPDDRKPITKVKDAIKSGVKQSLTNPSTYAKALRSALPKEYGELYDDTEKVTRSVGKIYKDAEKQMKPAVGDAARAVNQYVPESMGRLKDSLKRVEDWGADRAKLKSISEEEQRDANVALELNSVFKEQAKESLKQRAEDKAKERVDDALSFMRHKDQMGALNQMSMDMRRLAQYQTNVTQAYQKKSLELQFRSYYVQVDTLELQKKAVVALTDRLDAISKNTGLPDFVKTRKSEYFQEQMRNTFIQSTVQGMFGSSRQKLEEFIKNISKKVGDITGTAAEAFGAAAMGGDAVGMMTGLDPNTSMYEVIAQQGAEMGVSWAAGKSGKQVREFIKRKYPKVFAKIEKGAHEIRYAKDTGFDSLTEFAEGRRDYSGTLKGAALNIIKDLLSDSLPGRVNLNTGLEFDKFSDIRNAAVFNQQTNKSITEVIPGLLSRILREVYVLRTNDTSAGLTEYDYQSNKFSTSKELVGKIKDEVISKDNRDYFARDFRSQLDYTGIGKELDDNDKQALAREFLNLRFEGKGFTRKNISSLKFDTEERTKRIQKALGSYYDADDVKENRDLERSKRKSFMGAWGNTFGNELGDPRALIQQYINSGQTHLLEEAGVINEKGEIDKDKLIALSMSQMPEVLGSSDIYSDFFLKENIQKFDPKKALESIRLAPVGFWNYKKNSVAFDGGKTHIGPMAQDMQKAFGDKTAPGGKKINLANMTSATMAAVQGLDQNVQTVSDVLKSQVSMFTDFMSKFISKDGEKSSDVFGFENNAKKASTTGAEPTLRERLKTIEELLAVIAANTSSSAGAGGVKFDELFIKDGKFAKFKDRWKDFFKAKRKTEQIDRAEKGSLRGIAHKGVDLLSDIGSLAGSGLSSIYASSLQSFKTFKDKFALPGFRKARDLSSESFNSVRDRLKGVDDVYVEGENKPRLLKAKLLQGIYIDFNTSKVISSLKDITGPVFDKTDNTIVIAEDEIEKLVLRPTLTSRSISIGKDLLSGVKNFGSKVANQYLPIGWGTAFNVTKSIVSGVLSGLDEPKDVYVKGETTPRLFKTGFLNRIYFLKSTGKPIERPSQITDTVIDQEGNILLTHEDFSKGLVDSMGKTIESIAGKLASGVKSGVNFIGSMFTSGASLLGRIGAGGIKGFKDFFSGMGFGSTGKESLNVLKEIRDILDDRLAADATARTGILGDHDDDGDRDNSWHDILQNRKDRNGYEVREHKTKSYKGTNIFDIVQDKITGLLSGAVDTLLSAVGLGGLFGKGKGAKAAAGAAAGAIAKRGLLGRALGGLGALVGGAGSMLGGGLLGAGKSAGALMSTVPGIAGGALATGAKAAGAVAAPAGAGLLTKLGTGALSGAAGLGAAGVAGLKGAGGALRGIQAAQGAGLFTRMMASGARGAGGVLSASGSLLGGATKAGVGLGKGALWGAGKLGAGARLLGTGISGVGRLLPGLGVAFGLGSAAKNIYDGNYGNAALNLGLAGVSGLGIGGTLGLLGTGLGALAGAVFSPVGLTALGIAGASYGAYKAYKWFTKKKWTTLEIYRMMQYGIGGGDTKFMEKIYNLEKLLAPAVEINSGKAQIKQASIKIEEILKIFDIKEGNDDALNRLAHWFENRFKPVFLTHLSAIFKLKNKMDLELVGKDLEPREKLQYLNEVQIPNGPWNDMVLPFVDASESVISDSMLLRTTDELRKSLSADIKPGEDQSLDKRSFMTKLFDSSLMGKAFKEDKTIKDRIDDIKVKDNDSEVAKTITKNMRAEAFSKGGVSGISVGSDKTTDWFYGKDIKAFEAVRLKAYGLNKFSQGLVASLRWLEARCVDQLRVNADKTVSWTGDPAEVLTEARKFFGFSFNDTDQNKSWTTWFIKRFLPIYTTNISKMAQALGGSDLKGLNTRFDIQSYAAVQICEYISAMKEAWLVKDSPWPSVTLTHDATIVKEHIEYIRKVVKDKELISESVKGIENKNKPTVSGFKGKIAEPSSEDEKRYAQDLAKAREKFRQENLKGSTSFGSINDGAGGDEGEPHIKESTTPTTTGSRAQKGMPSSGTAVAPAHADGEIFSGAGGEKYLKLKGKDDLSGVHPTFLKLFLGAVEEYGEKTGRLVQVNEGFRTYAKQAALKKKYGPRAASPGNSMHEFGLAIDINSADADAMEKLGLMRKYGLTRPVGAEPWHIEPAGVQLNFQKYKKDHQGAYEAIKAGIGKGGGGYGTLKNATKYGRNPELVKTLLSQATEPGQGIKELQEAISDSAKTQAIAAIDKAKESSKMTRTKDGLNILPSGKGGGYSGGVESTAFDSVSTAAAIDSDQESAPSSTTASAGSATTRPGFKGSGTAAIDDNLKALVSQIAKGEGTTDDEARKYGFDSAYDVPLGYGKFGKPDKPISTMTLGELKKYQRVLLRNSGKLNSSAVGKYQIVGTTLRDLQQKLGLSDNTVFSAEVQDKMAVELLKRRGLDDYTSGKISANQFQARLYHEWASIAHPQTKKAKQHTGTSHEEIQAVLVGLKKGGQSTTSSEQDIPSTGNMPNVATIQAQRAKRPSTGVLEPPMGTPTPSLSPAETFMPSNRPDPVAEMFERRDNVRQRPAAIQPEIKRGNEEITRSVKAVEGILTSSLEVQKGILEAVQALVNNSGSEKTGETLGSTKPSAPKDYEMIRESKTPKSIQPSPISVRSKVTV